MCLLIVILSSYPLAQAAFPSVSTNKEKRIEKFLRHAMIREFGFYTLLGTKPVTAIILVPMIDEDEKKELIKEETEEFKRHVSLKKYQPSKEQAKKLWHDWEKIQSKYVSKQFFFRLDEEWGGILFVNIPSVMFVMDKYRNEFSEVFGENFDLQNAAHVIGNIDEPGWQKIKNNHFLLGLLFGFGEMNAKYFSMEQAGQQHPLRRPSLELVGMVMRGAQTLEVKDLDIPGFISYHLHDPVEEHFKQEREKIIALYEGKDFLKLTLRYLGGNPPKLERKKLSKDEEKLFRENIRYNSTFKSAIPKSE